MKEFLVGLCVTLPTIALLIGGAYLYDRKEALFHKIILGIVVVGLGSFGLLILGFLTWQIGHAILNGVPS